MIFILEIIKIISDINENQIHNKRKYEYFKNKFLKLINDILYENKTGNEIKNNNEFKK